MYMYIHTRLSLLTMNLDHLWHLQLLLLVHFGQRHTRYHTIKKLVGMEFGGFLAKAV